MKTIKSTFRKIYTNAYFPFVVLAIGMVFIHCLLQFSGDDLFFREYVKSDGYFMLLKERYMGWSSRSIIEAVLFLVVQANFFIFQILDVFFILLLAVSISKIVSDATTQNENWVIVLLTFIYPFVQMSSAGSVSTSVNYIWPLAAGMFAFIPFAKTLRGQKTKLYQYFFCMLALLFAISQEQAALLICGIGLVLTVYMTVKTKRISTCFVVFDVIAILGLVYIMLCPGNTARLASEINSWFPGYGSFGIKYRIYLGMSNTFHYLLNNNFLFLLLTGILFYLSYTRHTVKLYKVIAAVPFFYSLAANLDYFTAKADTWFPVVRRFFDCLDLQKTPYNGDFSSLIPFGITFCVFAVFLVSVFLLHNKNAKSMFLTVLFCAGLASGFMLGFSPTVYASMQRIFLFLDFIMVLLFSFLYRDAKDTFSSKASKWVFLTLTLFALASYSSTIDFFLK